MKRVAVAAAVLFLGLVLSVQAQERGETGSSAPSAAVSFDKPASFKDFFHQVRMYTSFEPMFILNTEAGTKSAPSPVVYPLTIGALWPAGGTVSFQPRLTFFYNYYLWNDDEQTALPAEVENRTATALSFLLTLPAVFTFRTSRNSAFEAQAGVSLLMRAGILSNGVSDSDSGTSGSAGSDTDRINRWFWTGARFLYAEAGAAWLYSFSGIVKAGPELNVYVPVGSLISGRGVDAMMLSFGIKCVFK
jgi:hypothetical protein